MQESIDPTAHMLHRLKSARGHLDAVIQMYENQAPCDEVAEQLFAVRCALETAGRLLVDEDLHRCVQILRQSDSPKKRELALERILSLLQIKSAQAGADN